MVIHVAKIHHRRLSNKIKPIASVVLGSWKSALHLLGFTA